MGHKVNAISFRLRKNWNSFYFLKKSSILNNYILQDIYICEYISKVCEHQKKIAYDFKIFRCSESIFIFFKFFIFRKRSLFFKKKIFKKNKKSFKKNLKLEKYNKLLRIKNLKNHLSKNIKLFFLINKVYIFNLKGFPYKKKFFYRRFIRRIFKNVFFKKHFKTISKLIAQSLFDKSAKLLSIGLSHIFKKEIKHNRFLRFLKKVLYKYFLSFKSRRKKKYLRGYRIEIKGKLNGKTRKKKKIISNGPMPFSSVNSNIKYFFSESFTKFGVFGIKVWLYF